MKLTSNEKGSILNGLLKQQGMTASALNRLLNQEKGGFCGQAIEAKRKVDAFVKDFDRLCVVATRLKAEQRGNKPLSFARRSLERMAQQRPPLERFKHYAKTEGCHSYVAALVKNRTKLTATEAIVVFTHSTKSSDKPVSMTEAIRFSLVGQADLVRVAKKFCANLGFQI